MAEDGGFNDSGDEEIPTNYLEGWNKAAIDALMKSCAAGGLGLDADIENMPKPDVGSMGADARAPIQLAAKNVTEHASYDDMFLVESNTGKALLDNLGWGGNQGYLTTKFSVPPPSANALTAHVKSFKKVSSPPLIWLAPRLQRLCSPQHMVCSEDLVLTIP